MKLKIKKLSSQAITPTYGSDGAACFDLYAASEAFIPSKHSAGPAATVVHTGLAVEVPPGHVMKVYSRSGHGFKHGLRLANGTGIIDEDYRGEVMVGLRNDSGADYFVRAGERIAQAMIQPVERVEFVEVDLLMDTLRGTGGFGSTGS